MTDISKCDGKDCCIKDQCYRYTAPVGIRQSYIAPEHRGLKCPEFWEIEKRKYIWNNFLDNNKKAEQR